MHIGARSRKYISAQNRVVDFGEGVVLTSEYTVAALSGTLQTLHYTTAAALGDLQITGVSRSGDDAGTLLGVLLNPVNAVMMEMEVVQMA
ncbi:unnamed protein product [Taenia asiatica]|uniref:GCV_T domain-containing protein n=1 Tax=Taenia asiatica TaxID=60517 RepID=A0A0R3VWI6_TAEAS|nr:unnamed protein product [Taenia asiatica]